jgi:hypothetical protein
LPGKPGCDPYNLATRIDRSAPFALPRPAYDTALTVKRRIMQVDVQARRARWAVAAMFLANGFVMGAWAPQIPLLDAAPSGDGIGAGPA